MFRLLFAVVCVYAHASAGPLLLSEGLGRNRAPRIACSADTAVHAVWRNDVTGVWEVYHRTVRGTVKTPARRISTLNRNALDPVVAAGRDSGLYAVWSTGINGSYDAVFAAGADGGFRPALNISVDKPPSLEPSVAADAAGGVHVVWRNGTDDGDEVFYRSLEGGAWSDVMNVSRLAGASAAPAPACLPAGLCVAWSDDSYGSWNVYLRRRVDGTWRRRLAVYDGHYDGRFPAVCAHGDTLHLCWLQQDDTGASVRYRTWSERGWGAAVTLSGPRASGAPRLAAAPDGRVCAVWTETVGGEPVLGTRMLQDGDWRPVVRSAGGTVPGAPDVAAAPDGTFWCAWEGGRDGARHIYLQRIGTEE